MVGLTEIPDDVMIMILVRLSAKPLMQFKTVCKTWYHLISNPGFIRLHLDRTLRQPNSNLRFIFSAPCLSSADFDTFDCVTELDHPFRKTGEAFSDVVGSCHGLICLHGYDHPLSILLYNPTTRTHKKLPVLPKPPNFGYNYNFGFGYDSVSGDYKFVRVLQSDEGRIPFWSQVMVYSLRADSWMRVQDVPHPFYTRNRDGGVLVDGTLHWLRDVFDGVVKHHSIVSFNLSDHIFSEFPQPEYKEEFIISSVGVMDGCLCLLANNVYDADLWVMKEYGVVGSWTRLFSIPHPKIVTVFKWPIAYSRNRQELFLQLEYPQVVSLNMETMVIKEVKVCDFSRCFHTHVCVENLMMLKESPETEHPSGKKRRRWRRRRRQRRRNKRCFDTDVCTENLMMLKNGGDEIPETNRHRGKKRRR